MTHGEDCEKGVAAEACVLKRIHGTSEMPPRLVINNSSRLDACPDAATAVHALMRLIRK